MDEDSGFGEEAVAMADTAGEVSSELMSSSPEPASSSSDVEDVKPLDLSRPSIIVPTRPSIIVPTRSKLDRMWNVRR